MFELTFGSYEDAYVEGTYPTEDAAKIAAAEHCLDMIERQRRMPDPFVIMCLGCGEEAPERGTCPECGAVGIELPDNQCCPVCGEGILVLDDGTWVA